MSRIVTAAVVALLSATVSSNASAQGLPRATPESVGLSPDRLMRVDSLFESYIADGRMAGVVVAIARRGQLAHFRTLGLMDMAQDHPMRGDAIFRLASMTKPIISVAVLQLYEEGHFQLDDPVSLYIPELSEMRPEAIADDNVDGREMTVRDLLIHTAGLPGDDEDSGHSQVWANRDMTLQQLVTEIGKQPLAYSPGTEWRYSAATNILGYLVEVLSHQPLEVFLEQRVFQPLRMVDTRFFVPRAQAHRVPAAYQVDEEGVTTELWSQPRPRELLMPNAPRGDGGLFSTTQDYLRFGQMLLDGGELEGVRLLGRKTVELMLTDHLPPGVSLPVEFGKRYGLAGYGFGLGVRIRTDIAESQILGSLGEFGWGGGHGTYFLVDPTEKLIAIFMPQLRGSAFFPIRRQFNNAVYQALVN